MKKRKVIKRLLMGAVCFGVLSGMHSVAEGSSVDGYNRTQVADQNYRQLHGTTAMPEAGNDPELAAFCFGALGVVVGMWVRHPDALSTVINFIITPMTFFCGFWIRTRRFSRSSSSTAAKS